MVSDDGVARAADKVAVVCILLTLCTGKVLYRTPFAGRTRMATLLSAAKKSPENVGDSGRLDLKGVGVGNVGIEMTMVVKGRSLVKLDL